MEELLTNAWWTVTSLAILWSHIGTNLISDYEAIRESDAFYFTRAYTSTTGDRALQTNKSSILKDHTLFLLYKVGLTLT